jgi:hypothetical protein
MSESLRLPKMGRHNMTIELPEAAIRRSDGAYSDRSYDCGFVL